MRPSFAKAMPDRTPPDRSSSSNNKTFSGSHDSIDDYGDQSSSYWPKGWSFARWRDCTKDELLALPANEIERTQAGFRDVLGDEGFIKLSDLMYQNEMRGRKDTTVADPQVQAQAERPPAYSEHYEQRHRGQSWGFVCFRACCWGDDLAWSEYREKIDKIARLPFDRDQHLPGVDVAGHHFTIEWVEDNELENASIQELRTFASVQFPASSDSISRDLFLVATPQSASRLQATRFPYLTSKRFHADTPYLLAIAAADPAPQEPEDEVEWFQPSFKVCADTLADELWLFAVGMENAVRRITRGIRRTGFEGGNEIEDTEYGPDDGLDEMWWSAAPSPRRLRKRRGYAATG